MAYLAYFYLISKLNNYCIYNAKLFSLQMYLKKCIVQIRLWKTADYYSFSQVLK